MDSISHICSRIFRRCVDNYSFQFNTMNKEQLTKQADVFNVMLQSAIQLLDYAAAKNAAEHLAQIYSQLESSEHFWEKQ